MKQIKIRPIAIILASSLCALLVTKLVVDYSLISLLNKQASGIGRDWSHYVDDTLGEDLPSLTFNQDSAKIAEKPLGNLGVAVAKLFAVGKVFQIDFIDLNCSCYVSFADRSHFQHEEHGASIRLIDDGATAKNHTGGLSGEDSRKHFLAPDSHVSSETHRDQKHSNFVLTYSTFAEPQAAVPGHTGAGILPIDQSLVSSVWHKELHNASVSEGGSAHQDHAVAEIYSRLQRENGNKLVLRLLVDMDAFAERNSTIMYLASAAVLLLLILFFAYPATKHVENLRARRKSDANAHFLANHDVLTGLSNRNSFQENVPKLLEDAISRGRNGSLFLIDIDNFKKINDFYGHHVGDQVLQHIAGMLKDQVRKNSIVARLGGDELAIVSFDDRSDKNFNFKDIAFPAEFQVEVDGGEETFIVSFSVGISRFPRDGTELPELMRNADLALYDAKDKGKSTAREYRSEMKDRFYQRQALFNEFRVALKSSQILPFYQPIICTNSGRVAGIEALVRWQHPKRGLISASDFSAVFEDRQICEAIGCQMIERVTADMANWKKTNVPFERVGFNVNAANLLRSGFVLDIVSLLAKRGLSPRELAIEVTEKTTFGTNSKALFDKLHELREMGCEVVLDDFGTGYSSITHLKELPYTFLKIARAFISNIAEDPEDQAIVSSLIDLGKSLNYKVVAEGVETYEQYEKIKELGFHLSQGYYFSEPVSAEELPSVIDELRASYFQHFKAPQFHEDVA